MKRNYMDILDTSSQLQKVGNKSKALQSLMKTFNYIAVFSCTFYLPVYYYVGNYYYLPFQTLTILTLLPNFYFIKKQYLILSAYWLSITLTLGVIYAAVVTPHVQVELLLICITSVLQAMFKNKRDSIIAFIIIASLFVIYRIIQPDLIPITFYSEENTNLIQLANALFIFVVIFILIYYFRSINDDFVDQLKLTSKELLDKNEVIREQQEQFYEIELENSKKDLQLVVSNNNVKRKVRNSLIKELESIKREGELSALHDKLGTLIRNLNGLNESAEKSDYLQSKIEVVNTAFQKKLLAQNSKLTKSEIEMCGLIVLGLSIKDISEVRNTTTNSTNVLKHRLKKKLDLKEDEDLQTYLSELT